MGKRVNLSKKELEKFYIKDKLNTYQIASRLKCCQATVWKLLVNYNIKRRTPYELNSNIPSKEVLINLYSNKKLSTWKIEKLHGYSRGTIHRKLREYGIKTRDRADAHIIHPRKNFSGNLIEKAYLIGFRLGDLGVRKIYPNSKTIVVASGSTVIEQINLINSLFENYCKVWIKKSKNNKINIIASLNDTFAFLLDKKVPNWISSNNKHFFSFLAGFTDAEGNIGVYSNRAMFQIGNYDKKILSFIANKLNKTKIVCNGPYESDTSGYFNSDGFGHNQNYFQIRVNRKDSLMELFKELKPYIKHELKVKALNRAIENIKMRNERYDR